MIKWSVNGHDCGKISKATHDLKSHKWSDDKSIAMNVEIDAGKHTIWKFTNNVCKRKENTISQRITLRHLHVRLWGCRVDIVDWRICKVRSNDIACDKSFEQLNLLTVTFEAKLANTPVAQEWLEDSWSWRLSPTKVDPRSRHIFEENVKDTNFQNAMFAKSNTFGRNTLRVTTSVGI